MAKNGDETLHDDDGGKWDKQLEICDMIIDRAWDMLTEDVTQKKLTPCDLQHLAIAVSSTHDLAESLLEPPEPE